MAIGLTLGTSIVAGSVVEPPVYDADAATYFAAVVAAGSSVPGSAKRAVNTLVLGLKANSLWSKRRRINPRASSSLAGTAVCLAAVDGSATDTLTGFVAADYSPSLGLKGGANKYVNTGVIPSVITNGANLSLHAYQCSTTDPTLGGYNYSGIIGAYDSTGDVAQMLFYNQGAPIGTLSAQISRVTGAVQNLQIPREYRGLFSVTCNLTVQQSFANGAALSPVTALEVDTLKCASAIYVHARNVIGTARDWNDGYIGMYAIMEYLTPAEMVTLYSLWQAFEVAMGRGYVSGVYDLDLWGDSLTQGYSSSMKATFFPRDSHVRNMGIGGETSTQIAARMVANPAGKDYINIIWVGTNNPNQEATVMADIAAMVATLTSNRYIIMTPLVGENPTYYDGTADRILLDSLIANIAATYPNNHIDILEDLINQSTMTGQDLTDFNNRVVPVSRRADSIHLNTTGNGFVTGQVSTFITAKGW